MELELVTIGTELLLGFTVDTNSAFLGQALAAIGVRITRRTSVADEPAAVAAAVSEALARNRLVITTGGLGPTKDDLSKNVVAELFGLPLEFDEEIWNAIVARFARMGRKLSARSGGEVIRSRVRRTPGIAESSLAGRLDQVEQTLPPLPLAYLPSLEGVD